MSLTCPFIQRSSFGAITARDLRMGVSNDLVVLVSFPDLRNRERREGHVFQLLSTIGPEIDLVKVVVIAGICPCVS